MGESEKERGGKRDQAKHISYILLFIYKLKVIKLHEFILSISHVINPTNLVDKYFLFFIIRKEEREREGPWVNQLNLIINYEEGKYYNNNKDKDSFC